MTTPCTQWENLAKLKEDIALTNKDIFYMRNEISEIKANQINTNKKIEETNGKIDELIEKLDSKFVLRSEFKVGMWVLAALWAIASLIAYMNK